MTITGALVLYAVFWFMGLLMALPIGLRTHGDMGTEDDISLASSPINANVKRKMIWVSVISFVLWVPTCVIIASGWIGIEAIDFWGRMDAG